MCVCDIFKYCMHQQLNQSLSLDLDRDSDLELDRERDLERLLRFLRWCFFLRRFFFLLFSSLSRFETTSGMLGVSPRMSLNLFCS